MSEDRTPIIIDTDPGIDDVLAILLALASPEVEILGYVVSFGNSTVQTAYLNIFKTYEAVSRHVELHPEDKARFPNISSSVKPFVARGADGPTGGEKHMAQYFHGRDGLGNITDRHKGLNLQLRDGLPYHPQLLPTDRAASEVTLDCIKQQPERSITYVVLGPLTNLANLLRLDLNTVRDRIGRAVCMGGALDVPGNHSAVAEFNFYADPYAVKEVLVLSNPRNGFPLDRFVLLPLDITTPHQLKFPHYKENVDKAFESTVKPSSSQDKQHLTHFTSAFLESAREVMLQFGNDVMELHDVVAIWCAIENPPALGGCLASGWTTVARKFDVERTGEITRGMLVVDRRDLGSDVVPAQVQVEDPSEPSRIEGVPCIVKTPGSNSLVKLMLERIWGVNPA